MSIDVITREAFAIDLESYCIFDIVLLLYSHGERTFRRAHKVPK